VETSSIKEKSHTISVAETAPHFLKIAGDVLVEIVSTVTQIKDIISAEIPVLPVAETQQAIFLLPIALQADASHARALLAGVELALILLHA
jgi:hypothetical protein